MVFCYQNYYNLLWEKLLKFEAEGQEFANILSPLEQFIWTVKGQNNFFKGQLISKDFLMSSFGLKSQRNFLRISFLASIRRSNQKNELIF
jgi:hypothetical protein